jgi:hypothetical protein
LWQNNNNTYTDIYVYVYVYKYKYIYIYIYSITRKVLGSIPSVAGVFSVASDSSIFPGVDSASKNEYQVHPGGKGGWCVRLTTYHLHVPMSRNLGALTSWNPVGLFKPVMGQLYLLYRITNLI